MKIFKTLEILAVEDVFNQALLDEMKYVLSNESFPTFELSLEYVDRLEVEFHDGTVIRLKDELKFPYPSQSTDVLTPKTIDAFNKFVKAARLYIYTDKLQKEIDDRTDRLMGKPKEP